MAKKTKEPTVPTVRLTQNRVVTVYKVLLRIKALRAQLPALLSRDLYRLRLALTPLWGWQLEQEEAALAACGGAVTPEGVIVFSDDPADGAPEMGKGRSEYIRRAMELAQTETDVEIGTVALPIKMDLGLVPGLTLSDDDLTALEGIIDCE